MLNDDLLIIGVFFFNEFLPLSSNLKIEQHKIFDNQLIEFK
jgi:hypothetical protein